MNSSPFGWTAGCTLTRGFCAESKKSATGPGFTSVIDSVSQSALLMLAGLIGVG